MLSLKEWFAKYIEKPVSVVFAVSLLITISIFFREYNQGLEDQQRSIEQAANMTNIALGQSNRRMIERLLQNAHFALHASTTVLCVDDSIAISSVGKNGACSSLKPDFWTKKIEVSVPGFRGRSIVAVVPIFRINKGVMWLVVSTLGLLMFVVILIRKLKYNLKNQVILPLLEDRTSHVKDVEEIRERRMKIEATKRKEEVANALIENNLKLAHDLKSPLRTMKVLQSAVFDRMDDEEKKISKGAVSAISGILLRLNSFAFERDNQPSQQLKTGEQHEVLLGDVLEGIIESKRSEYYGKATVELNIDPRLYSQFIKSNKGDFFSVISNLVNNAVEATGKEYPVVKIFAQNEDNQIRISVQDNGKGIPPNIIDRIFEKKFTSGKENGSGWGLFIVKSILEQMQGSIHVSSEVGVGTVFVVTLPTIETPEWFTNNISVHAGGTLIIFDDSPANLTMINQVVRKSRASSEVKILSVQTRQELESVVSERSIDFSKCSCLFDYNIGIEAETGISLAREYGLDSICTIFTENYDSATVIEDCRNNKMKIIPKPSILNVSMCVSNQIL